MVCSAIELMSLITWPISSLELPSLVTTSLAFCVLTTPSWATCEALAELGDLDAGGQLLGGADATEVAVSFM